MPAPRLAKLRAALDTASRSPLAVFVSAGVVAWASAFASPSRAELPAVGAVSPRVAPEPEAPRAEPRPARPSPTTLPRPVPRLRSPFVPGGRPGLDIALQDADGRSMQRLHDALARAAAGRGQARLLFYGASHTAADIYTAYLRRALQNVFGDAGHGFVLPVQPWRGYRHEGVQIARLTEDWTSRRYGVPDSTSDFYGVAGVSLDSDVPGASAFVETARGSGNGSRASRFELYYLAQPGGGHLDLFVDGAHHDRVSTRSATRAGGYATVNVPDGSHRLELRVAGDGPVRIFGVAVERDAPGVMVEVHGINGSRARSHLAWDDGLYREHLLRRNPDLVALAYGTNESGDDGQPIEVYEAQLRRVVTRVREAVPNAACLLIGPSDRPVEAPDGSFVDRPRTAQIIEAQWRVALESGCAFFDVVAFQGGAMSTVAWAAMEPPYAGRDHVHFTRLGYERMGEVLLGALLEGTTFAVDGAPRVEEGEPVQP